MPRLTAKINQHLAKVGEQYEEPKPEIAEACAKAIDMSNMLGEIAKNIGESL